MRTRKVIVVGAGIGGLTAALELAHAGHDVHILEAAQQVGGKLAQEHFDGHAGIDCGPTVFTMRWVFEALFDKIGLSLSEHLRLSSLDLLARHAWSDGAKLDLFSDEDASVEAIGAFAGPEEAQRYRGFCTSARKTFETLDQTYMQDSRPNVAQLMLRIAKANSGGVTTIHPFRSLWAELGGHFQDQRLRQLFGRYATYCGSSPFDAPGTLMLIAHVEKQGVWAVDGGMVEIAKTFARIAKAAGARITCGEAVREIRSRGGRACGVATASGAVFDADAVVFNGDVNALASQTVIGAARLKRAQIKPADRSQSAVTFAFLGQTSGLPLAPHTVCFSDDYKREFDDVFRRGQVPSQPTVYINAPDRYASPDLPTQTSAASPGERERLFMLINAPADGDQRAYGAADRAAAQEAAWTTLTRCGVEIAADETRFVTTTPNEFAERFPATGGALYGRASHGWQASFAREGSRTKMPGLYLAGGSVHPGAGVPMALISGRLAAAAVEADRCRTVR